jgi:hypothetical protein
MGDFVRTPAPQTDTPPMRLLHPTCAALLVFAAAACTDQPVELPITPAEPPEAPRPVGVYQIAITGLGAEEPRSTISPSPLEVGEGIGASMSPVGSGIVFEQVSSYSFTEGTRTGGGQRYVSFTYRVRNATGVPLDNLTLLLVEKAGTIPGTALATLRRFDGTAANPAIASKVVPTGAVALGADLVSMQALYPDVVQVLTEAEVSAITPPAGVTNVFPVGYVVRSRDSGTDRLLPATSDANQFDGLLTVSFRLPLQPNSSQDVFSFFFEILAVTDSEVRLTESMEEAQDTAAVRRLRQRATALGATTVTILGGSPRQLPSEPSYPGQRLECDPRTAGSAGSAVTRMRSPAGYVQLKLFLPGETASNCAANFRTGTPDRPAVNVQFQVQARAYDRYGNVQTTVADTVSLRTVAGSPPATFGPPLALTNGTRWLTLTFTDYGTAQVEGVGRRIRTRQTVPVAGVTRTWTAGAGTSDWHTGGNWGMGATPMYLDSVFIPTTPSGGAIFPVLASNVGILGVNVENGATIAIGPFNLTAGGDVATGLSGGITNTVGSLFLNGTAKTVHGVLPRTRVLGTYTLSGNVTARAPLRVESGRLRNSSFRVRVSSQ